jgi:putative DNA primase/helicase
MKSNKVNSDKLQVSVPKNIDLNNKEQLPVVNMTVCNSDYCDYFVNDTQVTIKNNDTDLMKILSAMRPVVLNYLEQKKEEEKAKGEKKQDEETMSLVPYKQDQDDYACLIIAELLYQAQKLDLDLAYCNKKYYRYNGKFYDKVEPEYLCAFLEMTALQSGLEPLFVARYKFNDLLLKQFETTAKKNPIQYSETITLINLQNCTYVVENGKHYCREHRKEDFMTYVLPFNYNKDAKATLFFKYLNDVLPDTESQYILAEFAGYIFAKHLKLAKMLVCIGNGRNGKSLFFKILIAVLGRQNVTSFSLADLCGKEGNARALIENKLLNYTDEMPRKYDQSMFKTLSDNNPINGKLLYKDMKGDITNYARLATSTNLFPEKIEATHGSIERYLFVHFRKQLSKEEIDPLLGDKIIGNQEELEGIFLWILDGLDRLLQQKHFTVSEESEKLQAEFKEDADNVTLFLKENNYQPSISKNKTLQELFGDYSKFCDKNGLYAGNSKQFSRRIKELKYSVVRLGAGGYTHVWIEEKDTLDKNVDDFISKMR